MKRDDWVCESDVRVPNARTVQAAAGVAMSRGGLFMYIVEYKYSIYPDQSISGVLGHTAPCAHVKSFSGPVFAWLALHIP